MSSLLHKLDKSLCQYFIINSIKCRVAKTTFRTTSSFRTPGKKIIQNFRHGCRNDKIELNKQDVRNEICSEDRE
jgi:hypothetical protein